jgi:hypothetical protein
MVNTIFAGLGLFIALGIAIYILFLATRLVKAIEKIAVRITQE